jgi:hypothetical protein
VLGAFIQNAGTFQLTSLDRMTWIGDAQLNAGTLDIKSSGGSTSALYVLGDINQASGHVITSSQAFTAVEFNGSTHQYINLGGSDVAVGLSYVLNNSAGATLVGNIPITTSCSNTILSGSWTGSGSFTYSNPSTLNYTLNVSQTPTSLEWPATNGPTHLNFTNMFPYPNNRLYMPGNRSLNVLSLSRGVLVLGNYDLKLDGTLNSATDSMRMIAAEGTGRFLRLATASATAKSYEFPVGNISGIPHASSLTLTMLTNAAPRYIGVRVKDLKHPADASASSYLSRYWTVSDDGGSAAYTYKMALNHPFDDVVGSKSYRLHRWDGSAWSQVPSMLSQTSQYSKLDVSAGCLRHTLQPVSSTWRQRVYGQASSEQCLLMDRCRK